MAKCNLCNNELLSKEACSHCGKFLATALGVLVFPENGRNLKKKNVIFSDKYILYQAGKGSGLKKGFSELYEISNIKDIVYPLDIKHKDAHPDKAIKFIDKNGDVFIISYINQWTSKSEVAKDYETLRQAYVGN